MRRISHEQAERWPGVLRVELPALSQVWIGAIGCVLAVFAVVQLGWMFVVILSPGEVEYGEAIIYDHAARLVHGEPLYQPVGEPPYTVASYTPVYYWAAAALRLAAGDGFAPGRILSCVAGLVTVLLVGYLAAVRTDRKIAGLFAGLVFLALGLATDKPWSALYKEDSVGIALSIGSVALLASGGSRWRIAFGALLAALALLTKQTFIAAGVAGIVWLWARDRKGAATFAAVAAMVVLVPAFVLEITTRAFIANVILANINPVSWTALESNARLLALYQLGPAAIVALYGLNAWQKRLRVQDDLMLLYWLASIAPLAGLSKVGSNYNYWIEFAASTAVVATGAIWSPVSPFSSWALGARAAAPLLLLTAQLAVLAPRAPIGVLPRLRAELSAREAYSRDFNVLVNTVRNEPGDVLANPLDVVVLANRSLLLEPFVFSVLRRQGRWDATDMVQRICARQFTLLILSDPLERPDFVYQGYRVWPEPVYAALQKIMILDGQQADRYLYRPGNRSVCS